MTKLPRLVTGAEMSKNIEIFQHAKQKQDALRNARINSGNENENDKTDTAFEEDALTAGKRGPIDTVIEVERKIKSDEEKNPSSNRGPTF